MFMVLKKLLPVAEEIGTIEAVHQSSRNCKYYSSDEIRIEGVAPDGRKFTLIYELEDKEDAS